jgi:hypothetical protein
MQAHMTSRYTHNDAKFSHILMPRRISTEAILGAYLLNAPILEDTVKATLQAAFRSFWLFAELVSEAFQNNIPV